MNKRITIIGVSYVGLTTGACLAELGHDVTGIDSDEHKIELLNSGQIPFTEPELPEMVQRNFAAGRLKFTTTYESAMQGAELVFICVDTPTGPGGAPDLSRVYGATEEIARAATKPFILVLKSTVPPDGAVERLVDILKQTLPAHVHASIVVNPEFLREGSAVYDFFHPDRVVVGGYDSAAVEQVAGLYAPLQCPMLLTDPISAQLTKYASNACLAVKISFINEIARIARHVGADIKSVAEGMGMDSRIGAKFLEPGLGYGGSCFPKDVLGLATLAQSFGDDATLLRAAISVNGNQRRLAVDILNHALVGVDGKQVCVLGLAFKAHTDDVREAPALEVIRSLCQQGAMVRAHDPAAIERAQQALPSQSSLRYCDDAYEAMHASDAILIATNWPQFKELDWKNIRARMTGNTLVDGRSLLSPEKMRALGFNYIALGS